MPFACEVKGMKKEIDGTVEFVAETDAGSVTIFLQFHNSGTRPWADAEVKAPLRIESIATADKNNKVAFRILPGVGTFRRRGAKTAAPNITMEAAQSAAVDVAKEIANRRASFDRFIVPRLVAAVRSARRSTFVSVCNETEWQIFCTGFDLKTGLWTCEPPGEIFPGEDKVLFGTEAGSVTRGKPQGTEAEVQFAVVTEHGTIPLLIQV